MEGQGKMFVLRHGESEHNGKFFAGNRYDTALTPRGEADAEVVTAELAKLADCSVIYHSELQRSRRTAEIAQAKLKELTGKHVPIEFLPGIHEVDGGEFSGLTKEQINAKFAPEARTFYDDVVRDRKIKSISFPGGEDYNTVVSRLETAIATIRQRVDRGEEVGIVTHANTINVLLDWLEDDPTAKVETHTIDMNEIDPSQSHDRGIETYHIQTVSWSAPQAPTTP